MGWQILVFTNIRQPMLKLKTHSGFHDLFRF
jgi:FMN phosphatase YigB (HAD superfamily)